MLLDELQKLKEELAARQTQENTEVTEEPEQDIEPEVVEEEPKEEPKEEPEQKEEKKEEEEKLDNAGYARLRREAAAERKARLELERQIEELRSQKQQEASYEDNTNDSVSIPLPPEVQEIVQEYKVTQAEREFISLEAMARRQHPEYDAVTAEYAAAMYSAMSLQHRNATEPQLKELTKRAILEQASEYARKGYANPVEEMYHFAKERGFTGKSLQKQEEVAKEEVRPNMDKVAENRKRSTGMTANNGRSEAQMTLATASSLSPKEWSKLPASEKQRLLYGR